MDPSTINGYIELVQIIVSAGLQTYDQLRTLLAGSASPADLDVILGEVQTRLARRGIGLPTSSTGAAIAGTPVA